MALPPAADPRRSSSTLPPCNEWPADAPPRARWRWWEEETPVTALRAYCCRERRGYQWWRPTAATAATVREGGCSHLPSLHQRRWLGGTVVRRGAAVAPRATGWTTAQLCTWLVASVTRAPPPPPSEADAAGTPMGCSPGGGCLCIRLPIEATALGAAAVAAAGAASSSVHHKDRVHLAQLQLPKRVSKIKYNMKKDHVKDSCHVWDTALSFLVGYFETLRSIRSGLDWSIPPIGRQSGADGGSRRRRRTQLPPPHSAQHRPASLFLVPAPAHPRSPPWC